MESRIEKSALDRIAGEDIHRNAHKAAGGSDEISVQTQLGRKRFRINILFDEAAAMVGGGHVDPERLASEQLEKLAAAGNWAIQLYDSINLVNRIDSAISIMKIVVEHTPSDHSEQPRYLYMLGSALYRRFEQLGTFNDLEEAILHQRRAVGYTPDTNPSQPIYCNGLGVSLAKRSNHLRNIGDAEEALTMHRRAVDLLPRSHPSYPGFASDFGIAFVVRFELSGSMRDAKVAVETQRYAINFLHEKNPDRAIYLHRLSTALCRRFDRFGDTNDIDDAITAQRNAVRITNPGSALKAPLLVDLARVLSTRLKYRLSSPDFDEALELFIQAAREEEYTSRPSLKLDAALQRAELCTVYPQLSSPSKLFQAYESVFEAIPQVVWLGVGIRERLQSLIRIGSVFNAAAAAAVDADNPQRALEWLEQGRSVVWGQVLRLRAPVNVLRLRYPTSDLADRLERVSVALGRVGGFALDSNMSHDTDEDLQLSFRMTPESQNLNDSTQYDHRLASEYEKLLAEVRKLQGFGNFLLPEPFSELIRTAKSSFIVVLNIDKTRCDALAICPGGNVELIPLRELTYEGVRAMQSQLADILQQPSVRGSSRTALDERGDSFYDIVEPVLGGLWQWIVKPILERLHMLPNLGSALPQVQTSDLPHITWCATGPLSFLPLHAAGEYRHKFGCIRLSDLAVSSYTPTLDALLKPRRDISVHDSSILFISQSSTLGCPPLPGVEEEIRKVQGHFPDLTALRDQDATPDAVIKAMKENSWIHLACHGVQDTEDAVESAFLLHSGRLNLSRLMSESIDGAELAVLSACQTATGDAKLPDEAVHLAASMLAVGYRSVVGTMWSIGDDDAPIVADLLYSNIRAMYAESATRERSLVAYALHEAVRGLREQIGESNFLRWCPFVHFGL